MENLFVIYVKNLFRSIEKKEHFRITEGSWQEGLFHFLQECQEEPRRLLLEKSFSHKDLKFGTESTLREVSILEKENIFF